MMSRQLLLHQSKELLHLFPHLLCLLRRGSRTGVAPVLRLPEGHPDLWCDLSELLFQLCLHLRQRLEFRLHGTKLGVHLVEQSDDGNGVADSTADAHLEVGARAIPVELHCPYLRSQVLLHSQGFGHPFGPACAKLASDGLDSLQCQLHIAVALEQFKPSLSLASHSLDRTLGLLTDLFLLFLVLLRESLLLLPALLHEGLQLCDLVLILGLELKFLLAAEALAIGLHGQLPPQSLDFTLEFPHL
mmetsp:Transcript_47092/g.102459  ORF Transcript_47092/g.102459 Transcript_47092/m.102459 type:complete len:245 (+) Transcript_47092:2088-2822(+)